MKRRSSGITQRLDRGGNAAAMLKIVFDSEPLLLLRVCGLRACVPNGQVEALFEFPMPALQRILGRITKLPDGHRYSSAQFDVQPDCADALFV
jgi:hypothetical protein